MSSLDSESKEYHMLKPMLARLKFKIDTQNTNGIRTDKIRQIHPLYNPKNRNDNKRDITPNIITNKSKYDFSSLDNFNSLGNDCRKINELSHNLNHKYLLNNKNSKKLNGRRNSSAFPIITPKHDQNISLTKIDDIN